MGSRGGVLSSLMRNQRDHISVHRPRQVGISTDPPGRLLENGQKEFGSLRLHFVAIVVHGNGFSDLLHWMSEEILPDFLVEILSFLILR